VRGVAPTRIPDDTELELAAGHRRFWHSITETAERRRLDFEDGVAFQKISPAVPTYFMAD
jgi:hypothetical protein